MKRVAGLLLILSLAACSKQEPSPPADPAPSAEKTLGAGLPRDDRGHRPPLQETRSAQAQTSATVSSPDPAGTVALLLRGEELFHKTCATCHMADGHGVPRLQPGIVGSAWISNPDPQLLLSLILRGSAILGEGAKAYDNDMAPQNHLSDAEIAAVASYVRQRFAAVPIPEPVTPAQVAVARNRPGLPE